MISAERELLLKKTTAYVIVRAAWRRTVTYAVVLSIGENGFGQSCLFRVCQIVKPHTVCQGMDVFGPFALDNNYDVKADQAIEFWTQGTCCVGIDSIVVKNFKKVEN